MESGLLSLRAELHKKKAQLNKSQEVKVNTKPLHKEQKIPKEKKSKLSGNASITDNEESLRLEKSRQALEKKALLYDQIKSGTKVLEDDELNERFLVNFQGKIYKEVTDAKEAQKISSAEIISTENDVNDDTESYKAKNASEEWVEYVDSFGRSRMCLRNDVEYMKGKSDPGRPQNVLHDKWEKVEEEAKDKSNIHYQDVLFDEARSHGTSFMPFSRDEKEREAQQQLLKDIGSQATKVALSKDALKRKRQKLMEERLAKVRQKKRLKMGLPVKDDDRYKTPPTSDEEDAATDQVQQNPENIIETCKNDATEIKESHVREWDIGKPGVSSILSQAQWIESRRKERENEFAPPTSYNSNKSYDKNISKFNVSNESTSCQSKEDLKNKKQEERYSEFAPPSNFDYYRPSTIKKNYSFKAKIDLEAAISKGLSQIRKNVEKKDT